MNWGSEYSQEGKLFVETAYVLFWFLVQRAIQFLVPVWSSYQFDQEQPRIFSNLTIKADTLKHC